MNKTGLVCPRCHEHSRIRRNGRSTSGRQRYLCLRCLKTFQLDFDYLGARPDTQQHIIEMMRNGSDYKDTARILGISLKTVMRRIKEDR